MRSRQDLGLGRGPPSAWGEAGPRGEEALKGESDEGPKNHRPSLLWGPARPRPQEAGGKCVEEATPGAPEVMPPQGRGRGWGASVEPGPPCWAWAPVPREHPGRGPPRVRPRGRVVCRGGGLGPIHRRTDRTSPDDSHTRCHIELV